MMQQPSKRNNASRSTKFRLRKRIQKYVEKSTRLLTDAADTANAAKNTHTDHPRGLELCDRLEALSKQWQDDGKHSPKRVLRLMSIVFSFVVVTLVVVNVSSYATVNALFGNEWHLPAPRRDTADRRDLSSDSSLLEVVKQTVPFVQQWYEQLGDSARPLLPFTRESLRFKSEDFRQPASEDSVMGSGNSTDNMCLEEWFAGLGELAPLISPVEVLEVLDNLGLSGIPDIVERVQPLLEGPTSTSEFLGSSMSCVSTSVTMVEGICQAAESLVHPRAMDPAQQQIAKSVVVRAFVVDFLTTALIDDFTILHHVIETMALSQRDLFEDLVRSNRMDVGAALVTYDGITSTLHGYLGSVASNQAPADHAFSHQLQMSILEGVRLDVENGFHDNARVGVALAAALSQGEALTPTFENNEMSWPLGLNWVRSFLSWNLASISQQPPALALQQVSVLLIPSVSCEMASERGSSFSARHLISLALHMMGLNEKAMQTNVGNERGEGSFDRQTFTATLGKRNLHQLKLASPSKPAVEEMLFDLCGRGKACLGSWRKGSESSPTFQLEPHEYKVLVGFVDFATIVLTGIGLEFFGFWCFTSGFALWTTRIELLWKLAQYLFSMMTTVSVGLALQRNYLGLLVAVLGFWKFGFPETLAYIYTGLFLSQSKLSNLERAAELINGAALAVHHANAALFTAMAVTGVFTPGRHLVDPILILVMQHWVVLLRHFSTPLYIVVQLILEVFFEWSVIANLELLYFNHWTAAVGGASMLFAHWLFLVAALLELLPAGPLALLRGRDKVPKTAESSSSTGPETNDRSTSHTLFPSNSSLTLQNKGDEEVVVFEVPESPRCYQHKGRTERTGCDSSRSNTSFLGYDSESDGSFASLPDHSSATGEYQLPTEENVIRTLARYDVESRHPVDDSNGEEESWSFQVFGHQQ